MPDPMEMEIEGAQAPMEMDVEGSAPAAAQSAVPAKHDAADSLPWVEKYRPKGLDELISHQDIITTIERLIDANRLPHMLFYGPPGTGKTSTVLACAKKLNGPNYKNLILELNASDDRGIDVVRRQIKDFASSRKLFSKGFKLIVLDEADQMTNTAQFALRRVIEKYTKNTRFVLICNYVNKIIPALQSRCTRFRFGPLEKTQIAKRMQEVIETEKVNVTEDGLEAIIRLSGGDMRKCLNVLQSCHLAYPVVNADNVYLCTGNPLPSDVKDILSLLLNESFEKAVCDIQALQTQKGYSLVDIVARLHEMILQLSIPTKPLVFILDKLSDVEYRLASGTSEKLNLGALVGAFKVMAELTVQSASDRPEK